MADTVQLDSLDQGWRLADQSDLADALAVGNEVWMWSTGSMRLVTIDEQFKTRLAVHFLQQNGTVRHRKAKVAEIWLPVEGAARTSAPAWLRSHHRKRTLVIGNQDVAVWQAIDPTYNREIEQWDWSVATEKNNALAIEKLNEVLRTWSNLAVAGEVTA